MLLERVKKWAAWTLAIAVMVALPSAADSMSSSNYNLNATLNSNFGNQMGSTNYGMTTTGGQSAIGNGASGSYMMGAGFVSQLDRSILLAVQPGGQLGNWDFNETTGTLSNDSSAIRADGNRTGSGFSFVAGKLSGGIARNNADANARIVFPAASIQPSSVTLETWVNAAAFPNASDQICGYYAKAGATWGPFELTTDGGHAGNGFAWTINNGSSHTIDSGSTGSTYTTSTWYHVVGTYDSATGASRLYVNGVEKGTGNYAASALSYTDANTDNQLSCFNSPRWPGQGLQGTLDHLKVFNRALTSEEVKAEYDAQNAGITTGLSLGVVTPGTSNSELQDLVVRTDSANYSITVSQDHDLQKGILTIPAVSGTLASPAAWSEGSTKGLGMTLISAPSLDGKWSAGGNYAAIPSTSTALYSRTGHGSSDTIDVISGRLRLDTLITQESGAYSNTVTYTATITP